MLKYLVTLSLFASVGLYDVSEAVHPALIAAGVGGVGVAGAGALVVTAAGAFTAGAFTATGVTAGAVYGYCKIKKWRKGTGCPQLAGTIRPVPEFISCVAKRIFKIRKWGKKKHSVKRCMSNKKERDRIINENKEALDEQIRYLKEVRKWCRQNPQQCNRASLSMSFSASTSGSSSSESSSSSGGRGKGRYSSSRGGAGGSSSSSSEGLVVGGGGGGVDMSESSEDGMVVGGGGGYPAQRGESVGIFGFDQYTEIGFILMAMFSLVVMIFCIKQSCFQQSIPMVYTASGCNQKTLDMEY